MKEAEVIETTAVAVRERSSVLLMPVMNLATAQSRLREFQEFVQGYLQPSEDGGMDGGDYGKIPGAGQKKVLLKSGADKLCELYGLYDEYEVESSENFETNLFYYKVKCILKSRRDDSTVGTGMGSCSTYESKYRWRDDQRKCPKCQAATIIKGNEKFGGGWVCWAKKGGCGAKFKDGDTSIEGQKIGRVENPDIHDTVNTVLKMAKKRAKIDAVIGVTRSSGLFTQDLDDLPPVAAKPHAPVTTEDIEIKPKSAAVDGSSTSPSGVPPQEGTPLAAETDSTAEVSAGSDPAATAKVVPAVEIPGADCIDEGMATNFNRMFKDALPAKHRKNADQIRHDWLRSQEIFDVLGKPSAYAIKKANFYEVREEAVTFAKNLE